MKILDQYSFVSCLRYGPRNARTGVRSPAGLARYWFLGLCTSCVTGRATLTSALVIPGKGMSNEFHQPVRVTWSDITFILSFYQVSSSLTRPAPERETYFYPVLMLRL
jgi:hypothetical protein